MKNSDDALYDGASELLSTLGNRSRLLIFKLLLEREFSVGELARAANLSQSALSQHLSKMRTGGLVQTRRQAQTIYYSSESIAVRTLLESIETLISLGEIRASERRNGRATTPGRGHRYIS